MQLTVSVMTEKYILLTGALDVDRWDLVLTCTLAVNGTAIHNLFKAISKHGVCNNG